MIQNSNTTNQSTATLNTILKSTGSGKANYHIGEIWHLGRTDYEIISWFDRNGERYYIGVEKSNTVAGEGEFEFYHILYMYKGKWRKYS